ncbi:putative O-linked N-acetylglucosamine transferase, SPINDLY family [Agrobacterium sp. DSM 25558]|uniref:O-linked N-acetylglucosamine transferase, SPINDLY family protein n=1 Tax=Agrobacterium sp. DSM 25558 TaxID=1907665 RepID=UPI00097264A3|nr:glycosyl transferase [Agrobacterium sp. DSM 25558]SCX03663.1 putative O-linked N-acetylglucosamine transferase, SPINDLY family [Agrobacterium sp. DSM 25558]
MNSVTNSGFSSSLFPNLLELAKTQRLALMDLFKFAESFTAEGRVNEAVALYKTWLAFNDNHAGLQMVYFNYSVTLRQANDLPGSMNAMRTALHIDPLFGPAHINLGRAFEDGGAVPQAIQQWQKFADSTSETTPDRLSYRLMALQHIGRVMENAGLLEEAETVLWQAMELRPEKTETGQHWTAIRQRQCKWPIIQPSSHITTRQMINCISPLTLGCYSDDPMFQLAKAHEYIKGFVGRLDIKNFPRAKVKQKSGTGQRLRVGYVSSDLRDHAVGFALREVLELHDKKSVEIHAYYCGDAVANDVTQDRMKAAVDAWHDIGSLSDEAAARQIASDEIDILIDVNGFTKHARTKIFAYRPAPVIVNFCGYPGSMGGAFHQYMIADAQIVPPGSEIYYAEKVLRIACNQPIDRKRTIAEKPTRQQAGLPDDAFVFACFNGMQKINASTFDQWMKILTATPGSVLWLLSGNEKADQRLRQLAEEAGIAPERIIFAPKAQNAQHLARIAVADLFLDTFPYGAHSTAADSLTVGLPVLTFPGKSFAARFCSSVVAATGVPELICEGPQDYVEKAIAYAKAPETLKVVRDKIQANRETSALRDIPGLARRLEELFWQMQDEAERGETPVPDLRNMDVYYEIGAELVLENLEFVDEQTYRQRYLQKLREWHDYSPIPTDNRLWTSEAAAKA